MPVYVDEELPIEISVHLRSSAANAFFLAL